MKHLLPATILLIAITVATSALMASMGMACPHSTEAARSNSPQGADFFIKNATQYGFAQGEESGRILKVIQGKTQTVITYWTHGEDGRREGSMTGTLTDGVFEGRYQVKGAYETSQGQVTLLFGRDGTARGTWDEGEDSSAIFWPEAPF